MQLEKEASAKPKVSRRKEIIKIRAEINEMEMKKQIAKINETKSQYFEKINKSDRPLIGFIKEKRERTQISKIRNEKEEFTADTTEIQRIMRLVQQYQYYRQLQSMEISRPEYWSGQLFPSPRDLPNPGIEARLSTLQAYSLPAEPQGKPENTGVGSLSLLQGIFPTQESNQGLLHCWQILYQLSYQGSPTSNYTLIKWII